MILVLRTWAIWNGDRRVLGILLALGISMLNVSAWLLASYFAHTQGSGPFPNPALREDCAITMRGIIPWILLTVFDCSEDIGRVTAAASNVFC